MLDLYVVDIIDETGGHVVLKTNDSDKAIQCCTELGKDRGKIVTVWKVRGCSDRHFGAGSVGQVFTVAWAGDTKSIKIRFTR